MRRWTAVALAAGLALAASGCTMDEPTGPGTTPPPPGETGAPSDPGDDARIFVECGGITPQELESIFGTPFEERDLSSGSVTNNDLTYTVVGCDFDGEEDDDLEVEVRFAYADSFASGDVLCVEPSDAVYPIEPVTGVGDSAWWQWREFDDDSDDDAEGRLVVCTPEALVQVNVEAPASFRQSLQQQAIQVAQLVID